LIFDQLRSHLLDDTPLSSIATIPQPRDLPMTEQ
jgi:hypothetical protein